jgi:nucleotide sugar dehydrogenase
MKDKFNITVVGLGKIGLPLALRFSEMGHHVTGFDVSKTVVRDISLGRIPFPNEPGLDYILDSAAVSQLFKAEFEPGDYIGLSDYIVVCVPLLLDSSRQPDFQFLDRFVEDVSHFIQPGTTVVLETTVPVGTTRNRLAHNLSLATGLELGKDLFVAFSPERISSGSALADLRHYPKIVGGIDPISSKKAASLYTVGLDFTNEAKDKTQDRTGVIEVTDSETAEFAKLIETTYRDVNIALANVFETLALGLNVSLKQARHAANSQPFSHIHKPSISVGGHCIPVYPHLLLWPAQSAPLISISREINDSTPARFVEKVASRLGVLKGRHILVAGISYRSMVKESALSGAFQLQKLLEAKGGIVQVLDPLFSDEELVRLGFKPCQDLSKVEAVIVHSYHQNFLKWSEQELIRCQHIFVGFEGDEPFNRVGHLAEKVCVLI